MDNFVKELKDCAATLSRIADALARETETPKADAPSLEEVRLVLARLSQAGLTAEVREIIKKHGADRLSDVAPAEYPAILKEAESLGK